MATINAVILKADRKQDGTWNVKFRITNNQRSAYIETTHFVTKEQLTSKYKLKNDFLIDYMAADLKRYRRKISDLGSMLKSMTAQEVKSAITETHQAINFIEFSRNLIDQIINEGRTSTAAPLQTLANSLEDYFRSKSVPITEINSRMLRDFERFLRKPREIIRLNRYGDPVTIQSAGLKDNGIVKYMSSLRTLFNECREYYNDEDLGIIRIPHYPFKKYKIASAHESPDKSLLLSELLAIRDFPVRTGTEELSRDLFMLSFYLCGMNAVDMYKLPPWRSGGIGYNRSKTKVKRRDNAYIKVSVPREAMPLMEKYAGTLQNRYSKSVYLNSTLSIGLRSIHPGLTFYHARHTFATLARVDCGFSKDDVAIALNHKTGHDVTDTYLPREWGVIDKVQEGVLSLLRNASNNMPSI